MDSKNKAIDLVQLFKRYLDSTTGRNNNNIRYSKQLSLLFVNEILESLPDTLNTEHYQEWLEVATQIKTLNNIEYLYKYKKPER